MSIDNAFEHGSAHEPTITVEGIVTHAERSDDPWETLDDVIQHLVRLPPNERATTPEWFLIVPRVGEPALTCRAAIDILAEALRAYEQRVRAR
jgi:hypothetical protein